MTTAELARLENAKGRVYRLLLDRGASGVLNHELYDPAIGGNRAVGRIDELRDELRPSGWTVAKRHEGGGAWRYWLARVAEDASQPRLW